MPDLGEALLAAEKQHIRPRSAKGGSPIVEVFSQATGSNGNLPRPYEPVSEVDLVKIALSIHPPVMLEIILFF